jgi:hypothetical protein
MHKTRTVSVQVLDSTDIIAVDFGAQSHAWCASTASRSQFQVLAMNLAPSSGRTVDVCGLKMTAKYSGDAWTSELSWGVAVVKLARTVSDLHKAGLPLLQPRAGLSSTIHDAWSSH